MKLLTILDCYIHNETILNKLSEFIDQLKTKGSNILLISNTNIPEKIQEKIDYCLYDTNNNLFSDNWEFLQHNVVKSNIGDCNIDDIFPLFQPHGLSVMINLFNAVQIGKSLGYTHFEKLEYDPLFTESSFNNISKLPSMCLENNKEGLFLLNDKTTPQDVSFHYFFCNIDFFFNKFQHVKNENDYRAFIHKINKNNNFINVERFLYLCAEGAGIENFFFINEHDRDVYFPNTYWNSEISPHNIPKKYKGCTSRIYKPTHSNEYVIVLSLNYDNKSKERVINCHFDDGVIYTINHSLTIKGSFILHNITPNVTYIEVFEDGEFLYKENISEVKNMLEYC
jgi:hypothetical protein